MATVLSVFVVPTPVVLWQNDPNFLGWDVNWIKTNGISILVMLIRQLLIPCPSGSVLLPLSWLFLGCPTNNPQRFFFGWFQRLIFMVTFVLLSRNYSMTFWTWRKNLGTVPFCDEVLYLYLFLLDDSPRCYPRLLVYYREGFRTFSGIKFGRLILQKEKAVVSSHLLLQ